MIIASQGGYNLYNIDFIWGISCERGGIILAKTCGAQGNYYYNFNLGEYSTPEATRMAFEKLKRDLKNNLPYIEIMTDEAAMECVRAHKELTSKE